MTIKEINICILIILMFGISSNAKETKYKVADIPKEILENARSVVRNEEVVLEVKSINNATLNMTYAITILNKNGLTDAYFKELLYKIQKIQRGKGSVFD